jgi:hypothetical protein
VGVGGAGRGGGGAAPPPPHTPPPPPPPPPHARADMANLLLGCYCPPVPGGQGQNAVLVGGAWRVAKTACVWGLINANRLHLFAPLTFQ